VAHALRKQWDRCFDELSLAVPEGAFDSLVERYGEPHRAYHTLQHIGECFKQFESVNDAHMPAAVGIALWFHDAIYDTRASDNEVRSARLAADVLTAVNAKGPIVEAIERLILATRHDVASHEHDAQIVVDIDLAILGAAESRYHEYEVQIRREYAWVDDSAFRRGRIRVLQKFLDRPFIFGTIDFRERLERKARHNLAYSMNILERS
jgi:predicted metal-dependent HD superfamily phosphohydrolase